MRKLLWTLACAALIGLGALAWTFTPQTLAVPALPQLAIPSARGPDAMSVHALHAGRMFNLAAFAYRGGGFNDERVFQMGAILVQHPQGTLVFDTGLGAQVDQHFRTTPMLMRLTSRYEKEPTVAAQLAAAGIALASVKAIVLTHAHWDHVSGLEDLPDVPVWVTQAERDFVDSGDDATSLARAIGTQNYSVYNFDNGPYLGFERSFDVFGDGSVVLVPAAGHTPGSIIAFINPAHGNRYALVGDLVWQMEGIDLPSEKPWISRSMVDKAPAQTRDLIVHMHQLKALMPDLVIVPAHDARVWAQLPRL